MLMGLCLLVYTIGQRQLRLSLKQQGTEEADTRIENIQELYSAVVQFQEENEENYQDSLANTANRVRERVGTCSRTARV